MHFGMGTGIGGGMESSGCYFKEQRECALKQLSFRVNNLSNYTPSRN